MPVNQIVCGDCLEVMKGWPDNVIDTIITDPPYGLEFMGKDWDKFGISAGRAKRLTGEATKGHRFFGHRQGCEKRGRYTELSHSEKSAMQEFFYQWATIALRIAKPGCMMLVFGGTRTYHRLTCAIEDAGWQIRDCMMWLYGSGFPKSHNVSKAIDKARGAKRKVVGKNKRSQIVGNEGWDRPWKHKQMKKEGKTVCEYSITAPTSDPAKLWDGWGTALKPAWEPIIVAMKPLDGTFAQNAEKWGVAGLNIDGGRIKYQSDYDKSQATPQGKCTANIAKGARPDIDNEGRSGFDRPEQKGRWPANIILDETVKGEWTRYFYCAKASRAERNAGLEGMEAKPIKGRDVGQDIRNVPYKQRTSPVQNSHPTVKPLALMEYLCKLTMTPTGGIVLDCFAGSGSTCIAAFRTGRKYIGIEKDADYVQLARRRLDEHRGMYGLLER